VIVNQVRHTEFKSVSVTTEARDALRRLTWAVSDACGEKLSMSQAILIAERMAFHDGDLSRYATEVGIEPPIGV
jgi:hypothetical protein